jgi:hypothetical protein
MKPFLNDSLNHNSSVNLFHNISLNDENSEIFYSILAFKSILGIIMLVISTSAIFGNLMVIICTINDRRLRTVSFFL